MISRDARFEIEGPFLVHPDHVGMAPLTTEPRPDRGPDAVQFEIAPGEVMTYSPSTGQTSVGYRAPFETMATDREERQSGLGAAAGLAIYCRDASCAGRAARMHHPPALVARCIPLADPPVLVLATHAGRGRTSRKRRGAGAYVLSALPASLRCPRCDAQGTILPAPV